MARKACGLDRLEMARQAVKTARTADELRAAQAVLLPLEMGLTIEQTAIVIGRSVRATSNIRTRYCKMDSHDQEAPRSKRQLRNRASATLEQEAQVLEEVLDGAAQGGIVVVPPLREKIAAKLGKKVALSTIYRMLARHGWRKLAPDTIHHKGNAQAREEWKKNSLRIWSKS